MLSCRKIEPTLAEVIFSYHSPCGYTHSYSVLVLAVLLRTTSTTTSTTCTPRAQLGLTYRSAQQGTVVQMVIVGPRAACDARRAPTEGCRTPRTYQARGRAARGRSVDAAPKHPASVVLWNRGRRTPHTFPHLPTLTYSAINLPEEYSL